jgi:hypothetical protein
VTAACVLAAVAVTSALYAAPPCLAQGKRSERASVSQTVAGTTITVEYSRPVARGRDSLFPKVVHWDERWTPGADWATTIEVDRDVGIQGTPLPKGKYGIWTVVRPDTWTVTFHRDWHVFHTVRPDTSGAAVRVTAAAEQGPPVEVLTFDFPDMPPGGTTLRFRWGTIVVPLRISLPAPPLDLVPSREERSRYLGRYDVRVVLDDPATNVRRRLVEITESGDTLRWRDADGAEGDRREFVLSPAGRDDFTRAKRNADGAYWKEPGVVIAFEVADGRASGFEVESEDGRVVARAERVR